MFKNLINSLEEKYNNLKKENENLNYLLQNTTTFQNLLPLPNLTNEPSEHKITYITTECPDINDEKAKMISKLIPIDETYLDVFYMKEVLTNKEFYLIPTTKYLWFINTKEYGAFYYDNLKCSIIKNNLMSKILILNNILIEINGNNTKIDNLINIINDKKYRDEKIKEKTAYLCGIIPIYQKINSLFSGISIDNNKNIVFHTKENNYKYTIEQIENYEILLDNQIYTSKKTTTTKSIGSFQNSCYQITIRITTKEGQIISIPILNQNTFGTKYNNNDSIFQKSLKFANSILNKLNDLLPKY